MFSTRTATQSGKQRAVNPGARFRFSFSFFSPAPLTCGMMCPLPEWVFSHLNLPGNTFTDVPGGVSHRNSKSRQVNRELTSTICVCSVHEKKKCNVCLSSLGYFVYYFDLSAPVFHICQFYSFWGWIITRLCIYAMFLFIRFFKKILCVSILPECVYKCTMCVQCLLSP